MVGESGRIPFEKYCDTVRYCSSLSRRVRKSLGAVKVTTSHDFVFSAVSRYPSMSEYLVLTFNSLLLNPPLQALQLGCLQAASAGHYFVRGGNPGVFTGSVSRPDHYESRPHMGESFAPEHCAGWRALNRRICTTRLTGKAIFTRRTTRRETSTATTAAVGCSRSAALSTIRPQPQDCRGSLVAMASIGNVLADFFFVGWASAWTGQFIIHPYHGTPNASATNATLGARHSHPRR